MVGDSSTFDDQIELADKRSERSRLGDSRVPPSERVTDPLVRIRAEDVVDAASVWLIRQVELLCESHVRQHEHQCAPFTLAKRRHMFRETVSGMREADAA